MQKCQYCHVSMEADEPREVDQDNFRLISHIYCAWRNEVEKRNEETRKLGEVSLHFKEDV